MNILLITTGVVGLIAFVLAGLVDTVNPNRKPLATAFRAALISTVLEFLLLFFGMPSFAHFISWGYFFSGLIVCLGVLLGLLSMHAEYLDYNKKGFELIFGITVVGILLYGVIALFTPPFFITAFNNGNFDKLANIIEVRDATQSEIDERAQEADLLKVSPGQALADASSALPPEVDSFAGVKSSYEQTVAGEQVYITDLRVDNPTGFRSAGKVFPGYLVRSAKDKSAPTFFVPGYELRYVPDANWLADLERHVYLNYEISCGCSVKGLTALQIEDDKTPWYTASVWKPVVGFKGMKMTGIILINPTTGEITPYAKNEIPEWIDWTLSLDQSAQLVGWWAEYKYWDAIPFFKSTKDKFKIDASEDVYGPNGKRYYMHTITTVANNTTLRYEVRVNPRTLEAVKFDASGKILSEVKKAIEQKTFSESINTQVGANVFECEKQNLLGYETWYCLLESRTGSASGGFSDPSTGINQSSGTLIGYAMLQTRYVNDLDKVIIAGNFNDAWLQLVAQSAIGDTSNASAQSVAPVRFPFSGTVTLKGDAPVNGFVLLVVTNAEYPNGVVFKVAEGNPVLTLTRPGDTVDLIADRLDVNQENIVMEITNRALPATTFTP